MQRYRAYSRFLREKFGCRVRKVSVDAGFTCPNRDGVLGRGGCIYCSNDSFRPETASRRKTVAEQVAEGTAFLKSRYRAQKFIVYFQPFSNTYGPLKSLIPLYESALEHPDVVGLSIGTRPDCIDEEKIAWLENLARTRFVTLEYGLESTDDATLERIHRGHNFQCWADAMERTRNRGIFLCAHLILGFPWESRDRMIHGAEILSGYGLDFLKIHHLHVVRNTPLADQFSKSPFPLMTLDEYADLVVDFVERLSPEVWLERLSGSAPENQLIGPVWGKSKAEIQRFINNRFEERNARQGRLARVDAASRRVP